MVRLICCRRAHHGRRVAELLQAAPQVRRPEKKAPSGMWSLVFTEVTEPSLGESVSAVPLCFSTTSHMLEEWGQLNAAAKWLGSQFGG